MKKTLLIIAAFGMLITTADAKVVKKARKSGKAKKTYYVNGDGTYNAAGQSDAKRPSPYKGNSVPENDGQKNNKERNLRYGQDATPIPGK